MLKIWGGNKKHQTIHVIAVVTHQRAMLYDKINAVVGDVICKDLALLRKYCTAPKAQPWALHAWEKSESAGIDMSSVFMKLHQ